MLVNKRYLPAIRARVTMILGLPVLAAFEAEEDRRVWLQELGSGQSFDAAPAKLGDKPTAELLGKV